MQNRDIPQPMRDVKANFTGEKVAREISDQLQRLIYTTVRDHLTTRAVVTLQDLEDAGMPNVTLRLATVQLFFDGLRDTVHSMADSILDAVDSAKTASDAEKLSFLSTISSATASATDRTQTSEISQDQVSQQLADFKQNYSDLIDRGPYRQGLREMGARVGWSFALNLIGYARQDRKEIPLNYTVLLDYWSTFDSATDIAEKINANLADLNDASMTVTVEQSFLIRGRGQQNRHIHCPFLEGYVLGVLDGLFLNWVNWIIPIEDYRPPTRHLRVKDVQEKDGTSTHCYLHIDLYEETDILRRPVIRLADAALNLEKGELKPAIIDIRGAIEDCLRIGMGLSEKAQINVPAYIKQAEAAGVKLSYKRFLDLYENLSHIVHVKHNTPEVHLVRDYLSEAWLLSREILGEFSPEDKLKMNEQHEGG